MKVLYVVFFLLMSCFSGAATASETTSKNQAVDRLSAGTGVGEMSGFVSKYITGKLQIGTRTGYRVLTDSDSGHKGGRSGSGTFLGTIYAIEETQDFMPKFFFAKYFFNEYFGIELAYDSIQGETRATSIGYPGIKSDGDITVSGPTVSLVVRYPTFTGFTPFASIGVGFYSGDFDPSGHWGQGYPDPSVYNALGRPSTLYHGVEREINIDDQLGITLGLGFAYAITSNWLLDLSVQYTAVDVDATFTRQQSNIFEVAGEGHFPMDNVAFRLGIAYQF